LVDLIKSEAVVLYSGRRRSSLPAGDMKAVLTMDVDDAQSLAEYVKHTVQGMYSMFPLNYAEQNKMEPTEVIVLIESALAEGHPELNAEATAALAWMWSYSSWK
jgi:hypothetical protein